MIRNNRQLLHAKKRLAEIYSEIETIREQYSGIEEEIYTVPLENSVEDLISEIGEFNELINSSFHDAVDGVLKKPNLLDDIGELLTKLRIAKGISQTEMAEMLGWQQSNLSRFESGNYGSQSIAKIIEYADSLGVWLYVVPHLEELNPEDKFVIDTRPSSIDVALPASEIPLYSNVPATTA